jgi:hypothetical protein
MAALDIPSYSSNSSGFTLFGILRTARELTGVGLFEIAFFTASPRIPL